MSITFKSRVHIPAALGCAILLSGCLATPPAGVTGTGSGGGTSTGATGTPGTGSTLSLEERITSYLDANVAAAANPTTVPTTGAATYEGYSATMIRADPSASTGRSLLSEATLEADFANNEVTGTLRNFVGRANMPGGEEASLPYLEGAQLETALSQYNAASGTVQITNGTIASNYVRADISGSVVHDGATIVFGDEIDGFFNGDEAPVLSLVGLTGGATSMSVTENGTPMSARSLVQGFR